MSAREIDRVVLAASEDTGAALLLAILTTAFVTAVALSLVAVTATDTLISGSHRTGQECLHAAEAGVERALAELAVTPDWSPVLASPPASVVASFSDGAASPRAPDGRPLPLAALTAARQAASDVDAGVAVFGGDRPAWRLYATGSLASLMPAGASAQPAYMLVWVADDGGDGDADPDRDANGRILVHAEAYGMSGGRRIVDVTAARAAPAQIRVVTWRSR